MTISYGQQIFVLFPGKSISLDMFFGGNYDTGGDYHGPIVVAASPIAYTNYGLIPSTVQVLFRSYGDLTSPCIYRFTITNKNPDPIPFKIDAFHD